MADWSWPEAGTGQPEAGHRDFAPGRRSSRPRRRLSRIGPQIRRLGGEYDLSQLQAVLYGPVHDAVLRYARQHIPCPGLILDVGCGTGLLPARLVSAYGQARVVGVDASTGMIQNAAATTVPGRSRFAAAMAERLPFADGVFDLVVVTLSISHWEDRAAGLAQIGRVMAPDGTLVAAGPFASRPSRVVAGLVRRSKPRLPDELSALIAGCGLRAERVEPIRSVASIADTVMVVARMPGCLTALGSADGPDRCGWYLPRAVFIHAG